MSAGRAGHQQEMEYYGAMSLDETELTLGLPGGESCGKSGAKRGSSGTVDLSPWGRSVNVSGKLAKKSDAVAYVPENGVSSAASKTPAAK